MSDHADLPRVIALVRQLRSSQIAHLLEVLDRTLAGWPPTIASLDVNDIKDSPDDLEREMLDDLQNRVGSWAIKAFGREEATNKVQRGIRLLEEAVELYQACGGDVAMAHRLVDFVFARDPGEITQEIGGVGITLLALADAVGCNAEAEIFEEAARIFNKPPSHFTERNRAKNDAGFKAF